MFSRREPRKTSLSRGRKALGLGGIVLCHQGRYCGAHLHGERPRLRGRAPRQVKQPGSEARSAPTKQTANAVGAAFWRTSGARPPERLWSATERMRGWQNYLVRIQLFVGIPLTAIITPIREQGKLTGKSRALHTFSEKRPIELDGVPRS